MAPRHGKSILWRYRNTKQDLRPRLVMLPSGDPTIPLEPRRRGPSGRIATFDFVSHLQVTTLVVLAAAVWVEAMLLPR